MSDQDPLIDPLASEPRSATSTGLLERVRGRDAEAWRTLVELYGPIVYGWCRGWGIEPEETGDLVQEVFQAVNSSIGRFRHDQPGASFRGWLWTIALNAARKYFLARGKRPQAVGGTDLQVWLAQVPALLEEATEEDLPPGETARCMRRALEMIRGDFQAKTWQAFWRTAIDGQTAAAVAGEMGLTKEAVRQARYRVLARLREEFGRLID